jgi:hypothetical protein
MSGRRSNYSTVTFFEVAGLGYRRNGKKIPLCVNAFTLRRRSKP